MLDFAPITFSSHRQRESAKRILCALIQAEGGEFKGQTRLYKSFYWAHLHYWKHFQGVLTAYPIARMPNGPGIDDGEDLLFEMQHQGLLRVHSESISNQYAERTFKLIANFEINLTPEEKAAIEYGLKMVRGKSAKQVSDETHEHSRNWRRLSNGKIMNIYEDLLSDEEVNAVAIASDMVAAEIESAFADHSSAGSPGA